MRREKETWRPEFDLCVHFKVLRENNGSGLDIGRGDLVWEGRRQLGELGDVVSVLGDGTREDSCQYIQHSLPTDPWLEHIVPVRKIKVEFATTWHCWVTGIQLLSSPTDLSTCLE